MTASTIANRTVVKKFLILKEVIIASTSIIINTVIMKDINPNVRKLMGKVNILNIPPIKALTNAIKTAANNALQKPVTSTPGIKYAASIIERAIKISWSKNLISIVFGYMLISYQKVYR